MIANRARTVAEDSRMRIALIGAAALVVLLSGFLYTTGTPAAADDPTILEADGGNVMGGIKLSGRGEFGEIQR